jgi:coenzyme PQQ precursor peptide PqqA
LLAFVPTNSNRTAAVRFLFFGSSSQHPRDSRLPRSELISTLGVEYRMGTLSMAWTTPTLIEICIGLEINGYLPAEF